MWYWLVKTAKLGALPLCGWSLVNFAYLIVIFSLYMLFFLIPSVVVFLVIVYFLFTPVAKQYFTGNGANNDL